MCLAAIASPSCSRSRRIYPAAWPSGPSANPPHAVDELGFPAGSLAGSDGHRARRQDAQSHGSCADRTKPLSPDRAPTTGTDPDGSCANRTGPIWTDGAPPGPDRVGRIVSQKDRTVVEED